VPGIELHGIDLSAPSADMAAKSLPEGLFVVANADRSLPYADRSFTFIASIDSRIHANEFARVLSSEGLVLVAVPGAEDLIELRERVAGRRVERPRTERVLEAMNALFRVVERTTVAESRHCGPEALRDLLTATYRGFRRTERVAVEHLDSMSVTLSHDVIAFRAR
jgi:23S rRNA (guanine745-N1)-methyltransferase